MKWNLISEEPNLKNKPIILLALDNNGKISCLSEVMESWNDALNFRKFEMKNRYKYWCYLNAPK